MAVGKAKELGRSAIGRQLVRRDRLGVDALISEQFPQELQCGRLMAAFLNKDIQNIPFIVDRAPQIHALAADPHNHFVQVPSARRR